MTERERLLLWQLMEFSINRYLIVNSIGREDGREKSDRHIYLVKIIMSYIQCIEPSDGMIIEDMFDDIHQGTKELTDNLDRIGLPLDNTRPNYVVFARRFFDEFIRLSLLSVEN